MAMDPGHKIITMTYISCISAAHEERVASACLDHAWCTCEGSTKFWYQVSSFVQVLIPLRLFIPLNDPWCGACRGSVGFRI